MTDFKKIAVPAVFLGYFMKFAMTVISWDPIAETKTRTALEMSAFFCAYCSRFPNLDRKLY